MDFELEKREAVSAGEEALLALREAKMYITKAKNWGIWDIFGGGTLVSLIKHSKFDRARSAVEHAKYCLSRFSNELKDISMYIDSDMNIFLSFFDLVSDNFWADIMVQSRLNRMSKQIDDVILQVEDVLSRIK